MADYSARRFEHLPPAAAGLGTVLLRPRVVAIACLLAIAGTGWLSLAVLAAQTSPTTGLWDTLAALCRPAPAASGFSTSSLALALAMWSAMTLAMMLPTAAPMILTYADIAETAAAKKLPVISPFVLVAGYCAVWLGFAFGAATAQEGLVRPILQAAARGNAPALLSAALFVVAGLYQFSSLKAACLSACQQPFQFFFRHWKAKSRGVFGLGLHQGMHCLGCCWAMMLLMFAGGAMNPLWMAALGGVMTVEKMTSGRWFAHAVGVVFVVIGLTIAASGLAYN
jgi:predicted metal-binding membrane protein